MGMLVKYKIRWLKFAFLVLLIFAAWKINKGGGTRQLFEQKEL